jgi:chromosome segregation ATPase
MRAASLGLGLMLVGLTVGSAPLLADEGPASDVRGELHAMRLSLDRLVTVLEALQQRDARQDALAALRDRIAMAEKRLAPLELEARALQQRKQEAEGAAGKLEKALQGLREMEKADTTGSAAAAFEAERARLAGETLEKNTAASEAGQQLATLERDITERRQTLDALQAQLERLLTNVDDSATRRGSDAK